MANRRGAAAVEFAVVSPIVFVILFVFIEFGRYVLAVHALEEAAREGCRAAVLRGATASAVQTKVSALLAPFGIASHTTTISPSPPSSVCQWQPITVTVGVDYRRIAWLPTPRFLKLSNLSKSCTLPREADECPTP
jgi:Flp pilus assembly protein TadG